MPANKPISALSNRYAFICMTYPPQIGGVSKHIEKVHLALKEIGINGDVIVIANKPTNDKTDAIWIPKRRLFGLPFIGWIYISCQLFMILSKSKYTILHFHDYKVFQIFMIIPLLLLKNTQMYITFHGWEGKCPPDPGVIKIRQCIAKRMTGCIAVGAFIQKWYGTPCTKIIYGGVDTNTLMNVRPINSVVNNIVYIGRLAQDTGILPMVEALAILKKNYGKHMLLSIYGDGLLKNTINKIIHENSLRVVVMEPTTDICAAFENSSLVFSSGYLTILEAWAARRIVFAYYDNPLREDYLRMHPAAESINVASTSKEIAKMLSRCIENPSQAIAKSEAGWTWARTQTWEHIAQQYIDLWKGTREINAYGG